MPIVTEIPYSDLDPNIVNLVRTLNAFPGISTIGSCGGHANPIEIQRPAGEWFVTFHVHHTKGGWRSLEFIAGATTLDPWHVTLTTHTSQPGFATGRALFFSLQGWGFADPDRIVAYLQRVSDQNTQVH
jgi:hypothetical protein